MRLATCAALVLAPTFASAQVGEHCVHIGSPWARVLCFDDAYRAAADGDATLPSGAPGEAIRPLTRPISPNPGLPMTGAEKDAFREQVQACWVVDPGAQAAGVTVTVVFELDRSGRLVSGPSLLTSSGGTPGAVDAAFQSARRAITRCADVGFDLLPEKYEQWRAVEMTFGPDGMRLR
jgi:hypothetical protein